MTHVLGKKSVNELSRIQKKKTRDIYVLKNDLNREMDLKLAEKAFVMILT